MWYLIGKNNLELDYSMPIIAEDVEKTGNKYLLLPQHKVGGFNIKGYDWFNLTEGRYNSVTCWKTAKEAVEMYDQYLIYNSAIVLDKI